MSKDFFRTRRSRPIDGRWCLHGVDPLSALDIGDGRGRIPLPSYSSQASPLVTENIFVSMPSDHARERPNHVRFAEAA